MERFRKSTDSGFNYVFEREFAPSEEVILKMPPISANKRGINDIGWQADGDITIYGTLASNPKTTKLWSEIRDNDAVNKTTTAIKIKNVGTTRCTVIVRAILN